MTDVIKDAATFVVVCTVVYLTGRTTHRLLANIVDAVLNRVVGRGRDE